jgi:WD40 repeat protein
MFSEALVYGYSLVTRALYLRLLSVQMVGIWQLQVGSWSFYSSLSCPNHLPGEDLAINLWDIGSGKRVKKMTGHTSSIYSLAFSAESSLLVSGGADWTVRCWDVKGLGGLAAKSQKNGNSLNGGRHGDDESIET